MANFPDKPPATWDEMYQLMLSQPSVGNTFVEEVNNLVLKKGLNDRSDIIMKVNFDYVERVYGVVLNKVRIHTSAKINEWKFVKVGMTGKTTKKETNNRVEQLMRDIHAIGGESSGLFTLPKGFYDTTSNIFEVEKRVRDHLGLSVSKELIKIMNLPCPTEWILTTQTDIDVFLSKIKEKKDAREWCTTQITKDFRKKDWKYWKEILPDGFKLEVKRNEIVLSSPGELPDWLDKVLKKFKIEEGERSRRSNESVIDEPATPSSPEGTKTGSSDKDRGKKPIPSLPAEARTERSKSRGKKLTSSLPKGGSTER